MSVPEWVRRKSGTMFSCHPPFALSTAASTLSPPDRDFRPKTPPLSFYHEYPIHSFAAELARRASMPSYKADDSDTPTDTPPFRKEEVAAALFSSPKRAATTPNIQTSPGCMDSDTHQAETENSAEEDISDVDFDASSSTQTSLPDLLASDGGPPSPTLSHHEAITPGTELYDPLYHHHRQEKLHCPKCGVTLTVVMEEEEDDRFAEGGEAKGSCACTGAKEKGGGRLAVNEVEEEEEDDEEEEEEEELKNRMRREGPVQVCRGAW